MSERSKTRSGWPGWARSLAFGLCLLPPAVLAVLVWQNAVNVPYWDEWDDDIAGLFVKFSDGTLTFGDLWAQHNESRFVLPRLIYLALGQFTHWNLCYEMGLTFLLISLAAGAVCLLGRRTFAGQPAVRWSVFSLASLLLFTPAQYEALLWGMEFILYLPLVCILISLLLWQTTLGERMKILLCAGLAVVSTYSFSNGLLVWIALFPVLFLSDGWVGLRTKSWRALGWLLGFAGNMALYFYDYQAVRYAIDDSFPPALGVGERLWASSRLAGEYLLVFFGGPLTDQHGTNRIANAVAIGGILLALFITSAALAFRWRKNTLLAARVWPWLTLGGYSLLSALLATAGRSRMGAEQAMSSRYAIFSICLVVALVHLVPLLVFHRLPAEKSPENKANLPLPLLATSGGLILLFHVLAFPSAVLDMSAFKLNRLQGKSCLKFLNILPPQPPTPLIVYSDPAKLNSMANALDQRGWFTYALLRTNRVSSFTQRPPPSQPISRIETCQVNGHELLIRGWTLSATRHAPADCVAFSCESQGTDPVFFALFDQRLVRPDLVQQNHDPAYLYAGWEKIIHLTDLPKGKLRIKLWVYDVADDTITTLPGDIDLKNN